MFLAPIIGIPACLPLVGSYHIPGVPLLLAGVTVDGVSDTLLPAVATFVSHAGETVIEATLVSCPWVGFPEKVVYFGAPQLHNQERIFLP